MAKISNVQGNDASNPNGPSSRPGYKGGRRKSVGSSKTAGGPGVKEQALSGARSSSLAIKHAFRSGNQDARMGGDKSGPVSPSALQVKTRRSGSGASMISPPAHGRE